MHNVVTNKKTTQRKLGWFNICIIGNNWCSSTLLLFFCCALHILYTFYQLENQCISLDASLGVISMAGLTYPCYLEQKDNRGQWYWIYYAVNGEAISRSSESYVNRSDCEHSISLMKNSSASTIFKTE